MTDNDIVKALVTCIAGNCTEFGCPLFDENDTADCTVCMTKLIEHALDHINRQKAEIESLKITIEVTRDNLGDARAELQKAEAEIEQLKEAYSVYEETTGLKQVRAEAIKEFAERLKAEATLQHGGVTVVYGSCIDNLVKEMTEETP